ncbi:MAG TPA: hypothetical protein PKU86_07780 [Bacteroidales bacterium]|jgi:hypothetical protein|nr:hypothetical protein [Bacteroidales bacterium]
MKDVEIIDIINDIEKQYQSYKDGGLTFIKNLAKKVLNTVDEEKNEILVFFLNELEYNRNGFFSIALNTIVEMKAIELAPNIERIFIKNRNSNDESWGYSIIEALIKLNYTEPKLLYFDFVNNYLKNKPNKSYFLLVQYCNIDSDKGLQLLADYYSKFLLEDLEMKNFLESRIGFLVSHLIKSSDGTLSELVKLVILKNKNAGRHLKKVLLDYFNSDMAKKYPNILIEKEKKALHALKI